MNPPVQSIFQIAKGTLTGALCLLLLCAHCSIPTPVNCLQNALRRYTEGITHNKTENRTFGQFRKVKLTHHFILRFCSGVLQWIYFSMTLSITNVVME